MTYSIYFIGAGKLGQTLAHLIVRHKAGHIASVCNTSLASSQAACAFIGQGKACASLSELKPANIIFITTSDDIIAHICEALAASHTLSAETIVVHCSGALSSHALSTARPAMLASVHPIHSFANPKHSVEHFAGTLCALEGDEKSFPTLSHLFQQIGAHIYPITADKKPLHHAASVFASNYMIAIAEAAQQLFCAAGSAPEQALHTVCHLMQNTFDNLSHTASSKQALTGPMQRGDYQTIEQHLKALRTLPDPLLTDLYIALGKSMLSLCAHDEARQLKLESLLKCES